MQICFPVLFSQNFAIRPHYIPNGQQKLIQLRENTRLQRVLPTKVVGANDRRWREEKDKEVVP